jgi:hypothetical protein
MNSQKYWHLVSQKYSTSESSPLVSSLNCRSRASNLVRWALDSCLTISEPLW